MDIVERLRTRKATWHEAILAMELGADEIERLREGLAGLVLMRKAYPGCPCTEQARRILSGAADEQGGQKR